MESKKGFGKRLEQIIAGNGFYIVMALCAAIIGVSIWSLLQSPAPKADEAEFDEVLSEVQPMPYTPEPPAAVTEEAAEEAAPAEEAAEEAAPEE